MIYLLRTSRRKPAWTDRILHKSSPLVPVSQRSYDAHPWITMSDHRPISAEFLVDVSCVAQVLPLLIPFTSFVDSMYRLDGSGPGSE